MRPRGETDIISAFGAEVLGSNPSEGTCFTGNKCDIIKLYEKKNIHNKLAVLAFISRSGCGR